MYLLVSFSEVTSFVTDLIKKVFLGLYYLVNFIFEFFDYCVEIFSSLPYSIGSVLISVVTISIAVVIYKALHS